MVTLGYRKGLLALKNLINKLYSHAENINQYQLFESVFLNVLEKHAPTKMKTLRATKATYMTKALRKAVTKRFWKMMKPFFLSDKCLNKRNITLIEGGNIISLESNVANTLNTFFDKDVRA